MTETYIEEKLHYLKKYKIDNEIKKSLIKKMYWLSSQSFTSYSEKFGKNSKEV